MQCGTHSCFVHGKPGVTVGLGVVGLAVVGFGVSGMGLIVEVGNLGVIVVSAKIGDFVVGSGVTGEAVVGFGVVGALVVGFGVCLGADETVPNTGAGVGLGVCFGAEETVPNTGACVRGEGVSFGGKTPNEGFAAGATAGVSVSSQASSTPFPFLDLLLQDFSLFLFPLLFRLEDFCVPSSST